MFFGPGDMALASTLGGFAVAYLMRPIGALVLGHYGDRVGRRPMMLLSMGLMTGAMFATACLPTYEQAGALSGVCLILLRCLMAFSVGAEYTGVVAYLLEGARPARRGLIASLAAASSEVGALLAAGVFDGNRACSERDLTFRVGLAHSVRCWRRVGRACLDCAVIHHRDADLRAPVAERGGLAVATQAGVARASAGPQPRLCDLGAGIGHLLCGDHIRANVLVSVRGMSEADALRVATGAALVVILVTPLFGLLSDRIGRRPVLVALCATSVVAPVAMFQLMGSGPLMQSLIGAFALAILGGGVSAVGAVATAEQLPIEGRMSGLALGATTATAIFGGVVPYLSQVLLERLNWPAIPGVMIAIVGLIFLPLLWAMPETRPNPP